MKNKISKRLIAFLLCMVLVIGNSVSILADTPAPEKATVENQTKDASTTKKEDASKKTKAGDGTENVSAQSEDSADTKKPSDEDPAPEVKTTEEKKETTEASTEKKEDSAAADEKKDDPAEVTTKAKVDTDKTDETTTETTTGEQDETKGAEESSTKGKEETDGSNVTGGTTETSETSEGTTETAAAETTTETAEATTATDELKYEDEEVIITVSANEENAIPAGAALKVVPIRSDNTATQAQYTEVEKQLQEKAEKEDYTTLGFLAYDITFTDAQGNEVEPAGQVNVNMSYKKAVLPAGINAKSEEAADAEVTVLHLEEDANKQVQNVANLAENNQLQNIEVTEANAVKQAEFVAESFSVFTLIWGDWNQIRAQVIDTKGNEITFGRNGSGSSVSVSGYYSPNTGSIDFTNNDDIQDISNGRVNSEKPKDYRFIKAVVLNKDENYPEDLGTTIQSFSRESSGRWEYKYTYTPMGEQRSRDFNEENQTLYFVYVADELTTIETVDNTEHGITMTMKNYKSAADGKDSDIGGQYLNSDSGSNKKGQVWQGLVKPTLQKNSEGNYTYPITAGNRGGKNNVALDNLFNGSTVNGLFSAEEYDATGYFEYSSFDNYAYLNEDEFEVYEQLGTPTDEYAYFYQRGNFMPYNPISPGKFSSNTNLYDKDGNKLPTTDARYNEPLYKTQYNGHTNDENNNDFYFGMSLEAKFTQPKDGMAEHKGTKSKMRYEFNGDDDLWVFIDGVLVLDIGGEHDAHSGYIDFATGAVHVDLGNGVQDTTIKEMFRKAGVFPDGTSWTKNTPEEKVAEYFDGNTFRDYTIHDMKMFYMERGAGASNLYIRFNLQTIPDGTILVGKNISNSDREKYANVQFAFQVYVQEQIGEDDAGNPIYSDTGDKKQDYVLVNGTNYSVKKNGDPIEVQDSVQIDGETYSNVFYLKPGEVANISEGQLELKQNQKYYVVEVGVQSDEYDKVQINGTDVVDQDGHYITGNVETPITEIGEVPTVYYTNNCSAENSKELQITKRMADGQSSDDTFSFHIQLESTENGQLTDYAGDYYIKTIGDNGQSTNYVFQGKNLVPGKGPAGTTNNGIVSGIPVGYTVAITQLLSGTTFKVTEVGYDEDVYITPDITIDDDSTGKPTAGDPDDVDKKGTGSILLGQDAKVTVTNSKNVKSIYVEKKWKEGNDGNVEKDTVTFGVFKQKADDSLTLVQVADITTQNQWKHTFTDLPVKENNSDITYTIREVTETTQTGSGTYTLNGKQYRILNESDYINEYYHASDDPQGTGTSTSPFTIENGLKTFGINVVKKDSEGNWMEGVEFELCLDKAGEQKVHFTKVDGKYVYSADSGVGSTTTLATDNTSGQTGVKDNPNLVITGLPADTYYLIETKTQSGFSLLANPVEIVLPCASDELSESQSPYYQETDGSQTTYYYDSYTAVIENNKLFTMPEAGGRNIFMMTLAGTAMIALAAGSTIYYRRRRGAHNKTRR